MEDGGIETAERWMSILCIYTGQGRRWHFVVVAAVTFPFPFKGVVGSRVGSTGV